MTNYCKTSTMLLLQRLSDAMNDDVGAKRVSHEGCMKDVLNAYLLVVGARPSVRLDGSSYQRKKGFMVPWANSAFLRSLKAEAKQSNMKIEVVLGYEPIAMNVDRVSAKDMSIIRRLYKPKRSDLDEPLVGAIGRALGYECAYPHDRLIIHWSTLVFWLEYHNGAKVLSVQLAAYGCTSAKAKDTWRSCRAALDGTLVSFRGKRYVIRAGYI